MIKVEHLSKTYNIKDGNVEALKDVSFAVKEGDIFGIIGLSGAGKSTLVRCLNLLEKPTEGKVYVDNKDLISISESDLRQTRKEIGMIFQSFNLLMQKSVLDNVCLPMELNGVSKAVAREKAKEYLEIVGLSSKLKVYPAQLSSGQKQRVAIARVLASAPKVLLCDEATSALDPETTKSILKLIKDINKKYKITVVVITHEMAVIQEICDRCIVLEDGKLVEENSVEQLFKHPKTSAAKRLIYNTTTAVKNMEDGRIVRIAFDQSNTSEPVIANLILEFKKPVSILESNISNIKGKQRGQMLIRLPDDEKVANKMIDYLKENKSITVEEVKSYE